MALPTGISNEKRIDKMIPPINSISAVNNSILLTNLTNPAIVMLLNASFNNSLSFKEIFSLIAKIIMSRTS